jgi:TonB family protein
MLQQQIEGKYEVLGQIEEEDGIGEVYKIRHLFLDEVRQIRVVRPSMVMTAEATETFLQEARVVIKLRQPNIAQLHDFTIDEAGNAFIVTEFIEGVTLEEALAKEGTPPVRMAVRLAQQALRGLGYLHRAGIVHRDVSPEKLVLTRDVDGQPLVKWVDLGFAKILGEGEETSPAAGMFPARPRYASPEQFGMAGGGEVDVRSDLYSFGVVLYEMLTGRCPIAGHDPFSYMAGHLSAPPLDFAESDPQGQLSGELRVAVLQALAKRPEERIASAEELARRLVMLEDRLPDDSGVDYLERSLRHGRKRVVPVPPQALAPPPPKPTPVRVPPPPPAPVPAEAVKAAPVLPASPPPPTLVPVAVPVVAPPPAEPEPGLPLYSSVRPVPKMDWAERPLESSSPLQASPPPPQPEPPKPAVPQPAPPERTEGERSRTKELVLAAAAVLVLVGGLGIGIWVYWNPSNSTPPAVTEEPAEVEPVKTDEPVPPAILETVEVSNEPAPSPVQPVQPTPVPAVTPKETPRSREPQRAVIPPPPPATVTSEVRAETARELPASPALPQDPPQRGKMITGGPGVEYAEPVNLPDAAYPHKARGTGRKPKVKVSVFVDENGNVLQTRVREGDPSGLGFNEAALEAARKARFLPATKDGVPGKSWTDVLYEFDDPGLPAAAPPATPAAPPPATQAAPPPAAEPTPPAEPPPGSPHPNPLPRGEGEKLGRMGFR